MVSAPACICDNCLKITCKQQTCFTYYSLSAIYELITNYIQCLYCNHIQCMTWCSHVSNDKESVAPNRSWKLETMFSVITKHEGESNENLKSAIKFQNTAQLSVS